MNINKLIDNKKGMMGSTHAAGALALILYLSLFFLPITFLESISLWIYILAVYAGQGPDIDHPEANIARNPFFRPLHWILKPFIEGHRAKETHSFFWALVFWVITIPIAVIFWIPSWIALIIAYSSHFVLDFINPTGAKLFYCPFLNPKPRSWSLNNFVMNCLDWKNDHDTRSQAGVKTGEFIEGNFITAIIWGFTIFAIFVSYKILWARLSGDSFLLSVNPMLLIMWVLWLLLSPKLIKFIYYLFKNVFGTAKAVSKVTSKHPINSIGKVGSSVGKVWENIKDFFHYSVVAQLIFVLLLIFSFQYKQQYITSLTDFKVKVVNVYEGKTTIKDFATEEFSIFKSTYALGYNQIKEQGISLGKAKLDSIDWRAILDKQSSNLQNMLNKASTGSWAN